jgi:superfamily II DNA/RNA helicase
MPKLLFTFAIMQQIASRSEILNNLKIQSLNQMQEASIEAHKKNKDIILLSNTGSGKTLAFLLPLVNTFDFSVPQTNVLIIVPSRELAQQIEVVFKKMGTGIKITSCYGGHKREIEENNFIQAPSVIVGTPGRIADHIRRSNIKVETITHLILDEFDKTLELGFSEEVSFIVESLINIQSRTLTSATSGVMIPEFLKLTEPITLNFLNDDEVSTEKLVTKIVKTDAVDKIETLYKLICFLGGQSSIVFCNHRESVERVCKMLKEKGIANDFYHGAMEQQERDSALSKFRNGSNNILITTDLASRGLDIPNIRYIIHYHLPATEEIYTHRNGRTARMEASGTIVVMLSPEENLPSYVTENTEKIELPAEVSLPGKTKWSTLFISAGKKDKVNKIDIVGFFTNVGQLKKEEIGLIEVKDFFSFVAIRKSKVGGLLQLIKNEKIKNKKVQIDLAK